MMSNNRLGLLCWLFWYLLQLKRILFEWNKLLQLINFWLDGFLIHIFPPQLPRLANFSADWNDFFDRSWSIFICVYFLSFQKILECLWKIGWSWIFGFDITGWISSESFSNTETSLSLSFSFSFLLSFFWFGSVFESLADEKNWQQINWLEHSTQRHQRRLVSTK